MQNLGDFVQASMWNSQGRYYGAIRWSNYERSIQSSGIQGDTLGPRLTQAYDVTIQIYRSLQANKKPQ